MTASPAPIILVIDDDRDIRETVTGILEAEGYATASACHGLDALNYLARAATLPAAILLDLMMPLMNGAQFQTEQRKNPLCRAIPTIMMSAATAQEAAAMGMQLEHVHFLRKPISLESLLEAVARCVGSPNVTAGVAVRASVSASDRDGDGDGDAQKA